MSQQDVLFKAIQDAKPHDKAGILSVAQGVLSPNEYVQFADWLDTNIGLVLGIIK